MPGAGVGSMATGVPLVPRRHTVLSGQGSDLAYQRFWLRIATIRTRSGGRLTKRDPTVTGSQTAALVIIFTGDQEADQANWIRASRTCVLIEKGSQHARTCVLINGMFQVTRSRGLRFKHTHGSDKTALTRVAAPTPAPVGWRQTWPSPTWLGGPERRGPGPAPPGVAPPGTARPGPRRPGLARSGPGSPPARAPC